jgi:hypothetical protein
MGDLSKMESRVREAAEWMVEGSSETEEALSENAPKREDMVNRLVWALADKIWPGQP